MSTVPIGFVPGYEVRVQLFAEGGLTYPLGPMKEADGYTGVNVAHLGRIYFAFIVVGHNIVRPGDQYDTRLSIIPPGPTLTVGTVVGLSGGPTSIGTATILKIFYRAVQET